jgi:hypothetical protein
MVLSKLDNIEKAQRDLVGIPSHEKLEARVSKLEKSWIKVSGAVTAFVVIWTLLGEKIVEILTGS